MAVGSSFRVSTVDLAVTPKPCSMVSIGECVEEDMTYKWDIVHAEHDHSLMLWRVLRDAAQVRLEYMVAIQEGHFTIRLDPHLRRRKSLVMHDLTCDEPCTWHIAQGSPVR